MTEHNRRSFIAGGALSAAGVLSARQALGRPENPTTTGARADVRANPDPPRFNDLERSARVHSPDVAKLPFTREDDVKVFRMVAEVCQRSFLPGWCFDTWGYNGSTPGPTIEVDEGDRVRIVVENRLPEITSMHWHGLEVPIDMDGVPGVTQDPIAPGETFIYEFEVHQRGTFFYHSHMAMQEMMGMVGLFIIHPRQPYSPPVDRDFGFVLQEWAILPDNSVPNSLAMEFNWLTLNGRSGPHTTPLIVRLGDRVRLRFVNLGMDHHPMHLHGHTWVTTGTEGGRIPETAWIPGNTELVGVAQARDVEFVADNPGDWMLHCHLPHHMMNHMASMVGPMRPMGGMAPGGDMGAGMGISATAALSAENGPSMGRAIGLGATRDRPVNNLPMHRGAQGQSMPEMQHGASTADARQVPGFPQDHFMAMDAMVAKPETHGMRPTWSGGSMGMMTILRVLEDDLYDEVEALRTGADRAPGPPSPHGGSR